MTALATLTGVAPHGAGEGEAARVRMAANPATAPEMLRALAADPAITVRAAVALNPSAPELADRRLAADADERVRALLGRRLAGLLPGLDSSRRDPLQARALAALTALVEDEAVRVRAAIADAVKDMPDAPRALILKLAYDTAIPVSEPIIRLSPVLTQDDLLSLLAASPTAATATAVARRPHLTHPVADAVAASADSGAIAALLANTSAQIREQTLDSLIARAASHTEWHAPLVRRPELSGSAATALSDIVSTQLLGVLASRADFPAELLSDLRKRLTSRLTPAGQRLKPEPSAEEALSEARRLSDTDELTETALIAAAARGEARLCCAMLSVAADLPIGVVDRAATLRSAKGLVSLVWSAGYSMKSAGPLQVLLARLPPSGVLRPASNGGFPLAVEEMRWQIDFLTKMGR